METVLSGIRPTGNLHLGNYYGAVTSFVKLQEEYKCLFFIADWHSLTTHPKPEDIRRSARTILAEYLACGIDPAKSTIYIQSDVKEVLELYLYLNMNAYLGELERVTSFKDKARKQPDNVNAGLLTYPTLMAADILIHRAAKVPVGKDQEQNMEMARTFARRFNYMYGTEFFPEPQSFSLAGRGIKIPGLDGSGKMGKSEGNCIYINDDDKTVIKKFKKAVTDMTPEQPNSEMNEPIKNLFYFLKLVSAPEIYDQYLAAWNDCSIRYGDLKMQIATDVLKVTAPIRERYNEIYADADYLNKVRRQGAEKARAYVRETLDQMREYMGFKMF